MKEKANNQVLFEQVRAGAGRHGDTQHRDRGAGDDAFADLCVSVKRSLGRVWGGAKAVRGLSWGYGSQELRRTGGVAPGARGRIGVDGGGDRETESCGGIEGDALGRFLRTAASLGPLEDKLLVFFGFSRGGSPHRLGGWMEETTAAAPTRPSPAHTLEV
jgi:hypothetical protein